MGPRIAVRFVDGFLKFAGAMVICVSAGIVEAHPYQVPAHCPDLSGSQWGHWCSALQTGGSSDGCCQSWLLPPEPEPHSHSGGGGYSAPAVLTETETSQGCNPWVEGNIAEEAAKDKLRPKLTAYPGVEYDFLGCQYLGTVRSIQGIPIAIYSDYLTHSCPKSLNWNPGLSEIGRMYTMAARCTARRVDN